jgi:glutathione synthase/RimK-type ligase-like ATP-grasp enzyme
LKALWGLLDCLWVNHPLEDGRSRYKLLQLQVANEVGLQVPRSLVTTEPEAVKQFYEECNGKMIHKVLGWPYFSEDDPEAPTSKMVYTNMVDLNKVDVSRVQYCPCFFQEYVEKDVELRVTVVGERVFACEIHSQKSANPRTHIDWRNYSLHDTPHVAATLPAHVEEACRQFVRKLNLQYSALDLIRRPDGEYIFLESNPGGQYGWIEVLSGLPITEALADLLIKGKEAAIYETV